MKTTILILLAALALAPKAMSQAVGQVPPQQNDAQMLADSVAALQTVDTGLSDRLKQVADKPSGQTGVPGTTSIPMTGEDLKTIHDASAALRYTRPDLSAKLDGYVATQSP